MKSIKLSVVCDQAQSENVCVQLSDGWARISITHSIPFSASISIKSPLIRAARMVVTAVGPVDLEKADISVTLTGYDMCSSEELQEQVAEEWIRALIEATRTLAVSPTRGDSITNCPKTEMRGDGAAPPKTPGNINITTMSREERRAKVIRNMVQRVQEHVRAYGSAPDFSSERTQAVARVHNYIRSVTTRQQAPTDILEAVRAELASKQDET
jgi:hypothetical protein